jgi:hypothetical protein
MEIAGAHTCFRSQSGSFRPVSLVTQLDGPHPRMLVIT